MFARAAEAALGFFLFLIPPISASADMNTFLRGTRVALEIYAEREFRDPYTPKNRLELNRAPDKELVIADVQRFGLLSSKAIFPIPNGDQVQRVAHLAMMRKPSVDFSGYWQRRKIAA